MGGSADSLVTVVIPTHNRKDYLPQSVQSVLQQPDVHAEVIVVDDGSSDGTSEWLAGVRNDRVRSLGSPNVERSAARNAGLAEVRTPYVLFLDDDDLMMRTALRRLVAALGRHPRSVVAAGTFATFGNYGPFDVPRRQPTSLVPVCRPMWRELLWGWYLLPGAGLWQTSFLRDIGGWDESRNFGEDLELNLRIHPHPMAVVPRVTLHWRQHARHNDEATLKHWNETEDEVRAGFLARLSGEERRVGERILEARLVFATALEAYAAGDYATSTAGLRAAFRAAPDIQRSPVLGPWLNGLVVKSMAGRLLPPSVSRPLRRLGRLRRSRRFRLPRGG